MDNKPKNPYTEARRRANRKWDDANLFKRTLYFPLAWKELMFEKADGNFQGYIKSLVAKDLGIEYNK